jgi:peptidoglycan-associated lipoprotein
MSDDKLTIVGPEPTNPEEKRPHKKVNIEALLLMAKYDEGFKERLFADREKVLSGSGLDFSPGEKLLLANISNKQLAANIEEFRVPGVNRNSLASWTKAAAVVLLLTSIALSSYGCSIIKGSTPQGHLIKGAVSDIGQNERREPILCHGLLPRKRLQPPPLIKGIAPDMLISDKPIPDKQIIVHLQKVYFEYDRFDITDEAKKALEANAKALKDDTTGNIIIEGHCDERGTEEYNIALGQRRAKSVKKYLISLGIPAARMTTISFGEAKPDAKGHDESTWRLNRRVLLKKVKE